MVLESKLNSSSQIYLRWWYFICYRRCVATMAISQLADDSATPPPTERIRQRTQKKRPLELSGLVLWELTDWLLRRLSLLRLTPFRSARRGGPYKASLRNELFYNSFCFYTLMSVNKLAPKHIKTKRCRLLDISLLRLFCGSWRIRTADPLLVRQML